MLEYDRINISKGTDINKTSDSQEWYIFKINFHYQPFVCNDCYDLLQKYMRFKDMAVVTVRNNDYRIHFWYMTKIEAVNRMKMLI